jgi:hypothetical protein
VPLLACPAVFFLSSSLQYEFQLMTASDSLS